MKFTVAEVLQAGVQAHLAGNFQEAEAAYQAILDRQPNHADANHNLGALVKKKEIYLLLHYFLEKHWNQIP